MRIILLFLVVLPALSYAGEDLVTVTGQVRDESGQAIPGATVRATGSITNQAITDSEGIFVFSLSTGKVKLSFELDGYFPLESELFIKSSKSFTFTMRAMNSAESMIVTASRVNTSLLDSPSTGSVLTAEKIETSPAQNYADLLRSLPGVSASQISTRVFRITTRQVASAGRIPSELVLVDGRTMNIDLNGAASWDTIPIDTSQIEKIEVVHGPASAIWGPNAQTGVINIIAKTPEKLTGTSITISAGVFDRDWDGSSQDNGHLFGTNFTHGQILSHRFSFKLSAGIFDQDPLARPTGQIPINPDRKTGGGLYPAFDNLETTQPKFDLRLDQQLDEARLSYSGGVAWTEGTGHTSAGPAIIDPGSFLGYAKVAYDRENLFARFVTNRIHLTNSFELVRDASGQQIQSQYDSQDYGLEAGNSYLLAGRHFLSFGGNFRIADFDLTLAPGQNRRDQFGAYLQDEFPLGEFRFVIGGRIDKFNVTGAIFSPRLAAIFQPSQNHSLRASFARAFRPPTLLENYQNLLVNVSVLDLGQFDPAFEGVEFPINAKFTGNSELREETTTALEFGYSGVFRGNTTFGVAFYVNRNDQNVRNSTAALYTSEHPPENWPLLPEIFTELSERGIVFPSLLRFVNSGPIRYQGLELSLEHRYNAKVSLFANYSYQSEPVSLEASNPFPVAQLYEPPNHRFNAGADFLFHKYFASANIQFVSAAFWTDVLNSSFWGPTDSFTMINSSFGRKWNDGRIMTSLNITNLFNSEVQHHVFGDIVKRTITVEGRILF